MRRVMSIWLPQLPLERRVRMGDPRIEGVFAITREIKNAWRLTHISPAAREAGLTPGLSVPDARAIAPQLLTEPGDPLREDWLLRALRRWADKLSPWIALDPPDGLVLDITGCAHLFGGEREMADHTGAKLSDMHFTTRIGIADTKGAARALARFGTDAVTMTAPGQTRSALEPLPVEALGLSAKMTRDLRRVGLTSLGQLYGMKSAELARRFGLELTQSLSKALGHYPDPVSPASADPVFAARMNLPDPIGLKRDLDAVLERLTMSVCSRLEKARMGARHFHLTVRCVDTGDHLLSIGFARPCYQADLVRRQFERPLDGLTITFGADWFRLCADGLEPLRERQMIIGRENEEAVEDLAQTITTLGNRLGFDRVRRFVPRESHLPEREFTTIEAADTAPPPDWPKPERRRPLRVFRPERLYTLIPGRPPRAFEWRKTRFEVESFEGPERLSPEWWALMKGGTQARLRDYWAVQTGNGPRLWLMTYPVKKHDDEPPEWFVAGQFL